jgi:hypothetical protein
MSVFVTLPKKTLSCNISMRKADTAMCRRYVDYVKVDDDADKDADVAVRELYLHSKGAVESIFDEFLINRD